MLLFTSFNLKDFQIKAMLLSHGFREFTGAIDKLIVSNKWFV